MTKLQESPAEGFPLKTWRGGPSEAAQGAAGRQRVVGTGIDAAWIPANLFPDCSLPKLT
jgi:hypothetical protein